LLSYLVGLVFAEVFWHTARITLKYSDIEPGLFVLLLTGSQYQ